MKISLLILASITGFGVAKLIFKEKKKFRSMRITPYHHPSDHHEDWDTIDETSWESFPTSDPPGHY